MGLQEAEAVLPATGKLRELIDGYVDYDFAFAEFVVDSLSDELRHQEYLQEESPQKLTAIAGYEDPREVAKRLVESFSSLPRQYTLSLGLPSELGPMFAADEWKVELSPSIRIVKGGSELTALYPFERPKPGGGLLSALVAGRSHGRQALPISRLSPQDLLGLSEARRRTKSAFAPFDHFAVLAWHFGYSTYGRNMVY